MPGQTCPEYFVDISVWQISSLVFFCACCAFGGENASVVLALFLVSGNLESLLFYQRIVGDELSAQVLPPTNNKSLVKYPI